MKLSQSAPSSSQRKTFAGVGAAAFFAAHLVPLAGGSDSEFSSLASRDYWTDSTAFHHQFSRAYFAGGWFAAMVAVGFALWCSLSSRRNVLVALLAMSAGVAFLTTIATQAYVDPNVPLIALGPVGGFILGLSLLPVASQTMPPPGVSSQSLVTALTTRPQGVSVSGRPSSTVVPTVPVTPASSRPRPPFVTTALATSCLIFLLANVVTVTIKNPDLWGERVARTITLYTVAVVVVGFAAAGWSLSKRNTLPAAGAAFGIVILSVWNRFVDNVRFPSIFWAVNPLALPPRFKFGGGLFAWIDIANQIALWICIAAVIVEVRNRYFVVNTAAGVTPPISGDTDV
jgi:hypothetical protein